MVPPDRVDDPIRAERDFLLRLLQLGAAPDIDAALTEALSLMVGITGADEGYIQLEGDCEDAAAPRWWAARDLDEHARSEVVHMVSRGIVAEALSRGETIETPAAVFDARFSDRESVRAHALGAVLCAPIGADHPIGVIYLHRRAHTRFAPDARHFAELFGRHAEPVMARALAVASGALSERADPTASFRAQLDVPDLVGSSAALAQVLRQIALVAPLDLTVLISGPSGSGKTAVARAIVDNGPRRDQPLITLNCAALPDDLIESELFGVERGAHSTAERARAGKIAAAEGGTLFLDEIGTLSLAAQAKLLQVLQDRTYYPLGSARSRTADVRVLAATNEDLGALVGGGRFREDLYYRLAVLPIRVPGLDARSADIPALLVHLVARAGLRHHFPPLPIAPAAMSLAQVTPWRGNIRQLAHAAEVALVRATAAGAVSIGVEHLLANAPRSTTGVVGGADEVSFKAATREFQRTLLAQTLEATGGNVSQAARRLGITRSHVYNLIKLLDLSA